MNPIAIDVFNLFFRPSSLPMKRYIAIEQIKAEGKNWKPKWCKKKLPLVRLINSSKTAPSGTAFVKDNTKSVEDYLKSIDADLKVVSF
jgi:elongation factor Ts